MKYERLFSPLNIRGCVLPNRIMSTAAVTRLAAEDGHVTEAIIERYKRLAKGGLGAMVVEAAVVQPSRSSFNLRLSDDQFVPEYKEFIEKIRSVNPAVKIGIQLIHFLKLSRSGWRQTPEPWRPSEAPPNVVLTMYAGKSSKWCSRAPSPHPLWARAEARVIGQPWSDGNPSNWTVSVSRSAT